MLPDRSSAADPASDAVQALLGLSPTATPGRWTVHVRESMQTGSGSLHGGSAFGAAIEAMVATIGRPLSWATAQFVTHARAGSMLDLEVEVAAEGHRVTQARARLLHHGEEVLSAMGAFGHRPFDIEHTWVTPLGVPLPEDCLPRPSGREGLVRLWDSRVAAGRMPDQLDGVLGSGRSASWCRLVNGPRSVTAGDLAVMGDFTMLEVHDALGFVGTGNSLDNTLRVATLTESEWVLVDAQMSMVSHGFASVTAHLWSDRGDLLGVASQTLALRRIGPDGLSARTTKRFAGEPASSEVRDRSRQ